METGQRYSLSFVIGVVGTVDVRPLAVLTERVSLLSSANRAMAFRTCSGGLTPYLLNALA